MKTVLVLLILIKIAITAPVLEHVVPPISTSSSSNSSPPTVSVFGSGLSGTSIQVMFDGVAGIHVSSISASQVNCIPPSMMHGRVQMTVIVDGVTANNLTFFYADFGKAFALADDFDPGVGYNPTLWSSFGQGATMTDRCFAGRYGLTFGGTGTSDRYAITGPLPLNSPTKIKFNLYCGYGSTSACETVDGGENFGVYYQLPGSNSWVLIDESTNSQRGQWVAKSISMPVAGQKYGVKLKFAQIRSSGSWYDTWQMDNLEIDVDHVGAVGLVIAEPSIVSSIGGTVVNITAEMTSDENMGNFFKDHVYPIIKFGTKYSVGRVVHFFKQTTTSKVYSYVIQTTTPADMPVGNMVAKISFDGYEYNQKVNMTIFDPSSVMLNSVSPSIGDNLGGRVITISGTNIVSFRMDNTQVKFSTQSGRSYLAKRVISVSIYEIVVEAPAMILDTDIENVDLSVTFDGVNYYSNVTWVNYKAAIAKSLNPSGAPMSGGTQVSIVGENFSPLNHGGNTGMIVVLFGAVNQTCNIVNTTLITCTVGSGYGFVDVAVSRLPVVYIPVVAGARFAYFEPKTISSKTDVHLVQESFPSLNLDSKWITNQEIEPIGSYCGAATAPYAFLFHGDGSRWLKRVVIPTASPITVTFKVMKGNGGYRCEVPDYYDNLAFEYGLGANPTTYSRVIDTLGKSLSFPNSKLSGSITVSLNEPVSLQWRQIQHDGGWLDVWAIDDIEVTQPTVSMSTTPYCLQTAGGTRATVALSDASFVSHLIGGGYFPVKVAGVPATDVKVIDGKSFSFITPPHTGGGACLGCTIPANLTYSRDGGHTWELAMNVLNYCPNAQLTKISPTSLWNVNVGYPLIVKGGGFIGSMGIMLKRGSSEVTQACSVLSNTTMSCPMPSVVLPDGSPQLDYNIVGSMDGQVFSVSTDLSISVGMVYSLTIGGKREDTFTIANDAVAYSLPFSGASDIAIRVSPFHYMFASCLDPNSASLPSNTNSDFQADKNGEIVVSSATQCPSKILLIAAYATNGTDTVLGSYNITALAMHVCSVLPYTIFDDTFGDRGALQPSLWNNNATFGSAVDSQCGYRSSPTAAVIGGFGSGQPRIIETKPLKITAGSYISFYVYAGICEKPDVGEDLLLEGQTKGSSVWTPITVMYGHDANIYSNWRYVKVVLSSILYSDATSFRFIQSQYSCPTCDIWTIDDVAFSSIPLMSSLSTTGGLYQGGNTVTILHPTGLEKFTGMVGVTVMFPNLTVIEKKIVQMVDAAGLDYVMPPMHASVGVQFSLSSDGKHYNPCPHLSYTYYKAPVCDVSATKVWDIVHETVTINGTGFQGPATVRIGPMVFTGTLVSPSQMYFDWIGSSTTWNWGADEGERVYNISISFNGAQYTNCRTKITVRRLGKFILGQLTSILPSTIPRHYYILPVHLALGEVEVTADSTWYIYNTTHSPVVWSGNGSAYYRYNMVGYNAGNWIIAITGSTSATIKFKVTIHTVDTSSYLPVFSETMSGLSGNVWLTTGTVHSYPYCIDSTGVTFGGTERSIVTRPIMLSSGGIVSFKVWTGGPNYGFCDGPDTSEEMVLYILPQQNQKPEHVNLPTIDSIELVRVSASASNKYPLNDTIVVPIPVSLNGLHHLLWMQKDYNNPKLDFWQLSDIAIRSEVHKDVDTPIGSSHSVAQGFLFAGERSTFTLNTTCGSQLRFVNVTATLYLGGYLAMAMKPSTTTKWSSVLLADKGHVFAPYTYSVLIPAFEPCVPEYNIGLDTSATQNGSYLLETGAIAPTQLTVVNGSSEIWSDTRKTDTSNGTTIYYAFRIPKKMKVLSTIVSVKEYVKPFFAVYYVGSGTTLTTQVAKSHTGGLYKCTGVPEDRLAYVTSVYGNSTNSANWCYNITTSSPPAGWVLVKMEGIPSGQSFNVSVFNNVNGWGAFSSIGWVSAYTYLILAVVGGMCVCVGIGRARVVIRRKREARAIARMTQSQEAPPVAMERFGTRDRLRRAATRSAIIARAPNIPRPDAIIKKASQSIELPTMERQGILSFTTSHTTDQNDMYGFLYEQAQVVPPPQLAPHPLARPAVAPPPVAPGSIPVVSMSAPGVGPPPPDTAVPPPYSDLPPPMYGGFGYDNGPPTYSPYEKQL